MATGVFLNPNTMFTLDHDSLSFEFPEITRQVRSLAERHIEGILPKYQLPADRNELVAALFKRPGGIERWDHLGLPLRLAEASGTR